MNNNLFNRIILHSHRLFIYPRSLDEMRSLKKQESSIELKQAYQEMIDEMLKDSKNINYATNWAICLTNGVIIGGIGFKGKPNEAGIIEVGYGIDELYWNQGYTTEALKVMISWCKEQPTVKWIYAQTDEDNIASQKVLLKNNFFQDGMGEEGLLYKLEIKK